MLKKDLYQMRYAIILILIYLVLMQLIFKTVCPLKAFFGIDCPGCGLTHATIYLLAGDFKESWAANPICILWLLSIIVFIVDRYIHPLKVKAFPNLFIITGLITMIWYIFKIVVI